MLRLLETGIAARSLAQSAGTGSLYAKVTLDRTDQMLWVAISARHATHARRMRWTLEDVEFARTSAEQAVEALQKYGIGEIESVEVGGGQDP